MALIMRRRRRDPTGTMTVLEHLGELRTRLIVAFLALAVGMAIAWPLYGLVFRLLSDPFCSFMRAHPNLATDPDNPCRLVFLSVVEPFLVKLKLVAFMGFLIALPVILYEFWRFVAPGLTPRERHYALPFVAVSIVLFALGGWFALLTLPKGLTFLLGFAGTTRVAAVITIGKYIGFVTLLILAFGASFEFPLILISLTMVGVLSSRQLRHWRRQAVVSIALVAAVITPSQDWFTMTAMMVPLLIFYELAILVARLLKK
jgi:sec-independent protein translocase protein TatC